MSSEIDTTSYFDSEDDASSRLVSKELGYVIVKMTKKTLFKSSINFSHVTNIVVDSLD